MACTKYTIEQYNALMAALAQGVKKVKYFDKEVEYRDLDEMLRLQIQMERCLFPEQNKNNGRTYASFSKGTERGCRKYRRGSW